LDFNNSFDGQVNDLRSAIVSMYWGQPVVDLMERARQALLMPDAKESAVCQVAVALFARDLETNPPPSVPWKRYEDFYHDLRQLQRVNERERYDENGKDERKEITGSGELMDKIGLKIELSGVDFKYIRRAGKINKGLVIICALLWVTGEGR